MRVILKVTGDDAVAERLQGMAVRADDATPFFNAVARILLRQERDAFRSNAYRWRKLDEDTVARKRAERLDPGILRATGALERALTIWGAPGQRLTITPEELRFGLTSNGDAYYGKFHHKGKGVPKRPVVRITKETRERASEALRHYLLGRRV